MTRDINVLSGSIWPCIITSWIVVIASAAVAFREAGLKVNREAGYCPVKLNETASEESVQSLTNSNYTATKRHLIYQKTSI